MVVRCFCAAYCAMVRWTCWNTIFLITVIQAHFTKPYWKGGEHLTLLIFVSRNTGACKSSIVFCAWQVKAA